MGFCCLHNQEPQCVYSTAPVVGEGRCYLILVGSPCRDTAFSYEHLRTKLQLPVFSQAGLMFMGTYRKSYTLVHISYSSFPQLGGLVILDMAVPPSAMHSHSWLPSLRFSSSPVYIACNLSGTDFKGKPIAKIFRRHIDIYIYVHAHKSTSAVLDSLGYKYEWPTVTRFNTL